MIFWISFSNTDIAGLQSKIIAATLVFTTYVGQILPAFEQHSVLSNRGNSDLNGKTEPLQNDPVIDFV